MPADFKHTYHQDVLARFRSIKALGDRALAQLTGEELFQCLDGEANSVALIVKHMAGNMRSRWPDFLSSDGEKPGRGRDSEFVLEPGDTAETLRLRWDEGWQLLFGAIEPLTPDDLDRSVTIRGEPHQVAEAINRQIAHLAYHTGQIVLLAKHIRGKEWRTLTIPKGASQAFNAKMAGKAAARSAGRT
jgi:hypothetical protein